MTLNPELQHLSLQGNRISVMGSAILQFHPELTSVDISNNGMVSVQQSTFIHNNKITSLNLSNNQLTSIPDLSGRHEQFGGIGEGSILGPIMFKLFMSDK